MFDPGRSVRRPVTTRHLWIAFCAVVAIGTFLLVVLHGVLTGPQKGREPHHPVGLAGHASAGTDSNVDLLAVGPDVGRAPVLPTEVNAGWSKGIAALGRAAERAKEME